jgi:hypothetical protein
MAEDAEPQAGDAYLRFNGRDTYVQIPSIDDYSVSTTGELTVSAWMRPDTLNFPSVESNSDYRASCKIIWNALRSGAKCNPRRH